MKLINRLESYIKYKELSLNAFDKSIGAANGYIGKQIKADGSIGSDAIEKISSIYTDLNLHWLVTGAGSMIVGEPGVNVDNSFVFKTDKELDNQQVPLYDIEAIAGLIPLFYNGKQEPVDYIQIPHLPKCDGAIHVTGDSMYPLLKSGDIVLYKVIKDIPNNIFWGEMYLISVDMDGEEYISVKYIQKSELKDHIKLVSYNQHHAERDIQMSKVRALAFVKASIRINSMR